MHRISPTELTNVVGGKSTTTATNDKITEQLSTLQTSLKDLAQPSNNGFGNNNMMLMFMMMALRPQPTVVAAGGPVTAAPSSVVNISTRVRRW